MSQTPDLSEVISAAQEYGDDREAAARAVLQPQINSLQTALDAARADDAADDAQIAQLQAEVDRLTALLEEQAPAAPLLGASFSATTGLPAAVQHLDFFRHFFQPGEFSSSRLFANEPQLVKAYDQYGARSFSISVKPGSGNALDTVAQTNLRRFLASIPADVDRDEVFVTFYHEPDGNLRDGSLTLAQYLAGSRTVAAIVHEAGMKFGPIHNGNVYVATKTPKWGLYKEVWQANGDRDLAGLYDFWGVDCYSNEYEDPAVRMKPIADYGAELGLPVIVGELASPSADAARQAAWASKARAWCLANVHRASWWSTDVYRMTEQTAKNWLSLGA